METSRDTYSDEKRLSLKNCESVGSKSSGDIQNNRRKLRKQFVPPRKIKNTDNCEKEHSININEVCSEKQNMIENVSETNELLVERNILSCTSNEEAMEYIPIYYNTLDTIWNNESLIGADNNNNECPNLNLSTQEHGRNKILCGERILNCSSHVQPIVKAIDEDSISEISINEDSSTESRKGDDSIQVNYYLNESEADIFKLGQCNAPSNMSLHDDLYSDIDFQWPCDEPPKKIDEINFEEEFGCSLDDLYYFEFGNKPVICLKNCDEFIHNNNVDITEKEEIQKDLNCIYHINLIPLRIDVGKKEDSDPESQRVDTNSENEKLFEIWSTIVGNVRCPEVRLEEPVRDPPPINPKNIVVYSVDGQKHMFDLMQNRPKHFKSRESMALWNWATVVNTLRMADEIKTGKLFPPKLDSLSEKNFKYDLKKLIIQIKKNIHKLDEDCIIDNLKFYDLEKSLLLVDYLCKTCLTSEKQQIVGLLRKCLQMELSALAFVKNPQIIRTLNKIATQINSENNSLQNAARDFIIKIKRLFSMEKGETFAETFHKKTSQFNEAIGHLTEYSEVCLLTKEPHYAPGKKDKTVKGLKVQPKRFKIAQP